MIVTLPSPNTSSVLTGCDGKNRGLPSWSGQSYSAFCTNRSACGNSSTLPMWSGWLCETATYFTSDGLTLTFSSSPALDFVRFHAVGADHVADKIGSVRPVSQTIK